MVPHNIPCADIGSDHGLLVEYLINNNIVSNAYASDNKKGPFLRLNENLKPLIEKGQVVTNLADGLDNLPSIYQSVIIAGMGGDLIMEIIKRNLPLLDNIKYLILAPHGKESELRKFITNLGYFIKDENVIFEGHFYEIILFEKGNREYTSFQLKYGPINLVKKSSDFINKYQSRIKSNKEILVNPYLSKDRIEEINQLIIEDEELLNSL